ncbi:MAG: hypothetical protein R3E86_22175 [Pseudomonadales bacterium]
MTFSCVGAQCSHVAGGGSTCSGAADTCTPTDPVGAALHACTANGCDYLTGVAAATTPLLPFKVTLGKRTEGGDGSFTFGIDNLGWTTAGESGWSVTTENGTGTRQAVILVANEAGLNIAEQPQTAWTTSSVCSDGVTSLVGDTAIAPTPAGGGNDWDCLFTNTLQPDQDGDGVPDALDLCPTSAGSDGNPCPAQLDNGAVTYFCSNPLTCSLSADTGDCTDCVMQRIDGSASMTCGAGSGCVTRQSDVLECYGNCSYETPAMSGSCASGTTCTLDEGFTCQSDATGNGCGGTLPSGEALGCPPDAPECSIHVSPSILSQADAAAIHLDVYKATSRGDGKFEFEWSLNLLNGYWVNGGTFSITTRDTVGLSAERIYINPTAEEDLGVSENPVAPFELVDIVCTPSGTVEINGAQPGLGFSGRIVRVHDTAACTFMNDGPASPTTGVFPLPDNASGAEEISQLPDGAFGLVGGPHLAFGTQGGALVVEAQTGNALCAGSERLSFVDDFIPPSAPQSCATCAIIPGARTCSMLTGLRRSRASLIRRAGRWAGACRLRHHHVGAGAATAMPTRCCGSTRPLTG